MALIFILIGLAILALGALGHIGAGVSKVDLGNGIKFTVPVWIGGSALFIALGLLL